MARRTAALPASISNDDGSIAFGGGALRSVQGFGQNLPAITLPDYYLADTQDGLKKRTDAYLKLFDESFRANGGPGDAAQAERDMFAEIQQRRSAQYALHAWQVALERRFDNLYYAAVVTPEGGADHWPEARTPGRAHVSVNIGATYVDIPAALQSITPIINYVPRSAKPEDRTQAQNAERLMFEWRDLIGMDLIEYDLCLTKCLYGISWAKVYWDDERKMPMVSNIDIPSNLWVGWGDSNYRRMDWAAYIYAVSPETAAAEYGVSIEMVQRNGIALPWVYGGDHADPLDQFSPSHNRPPLPPNIDIEVIDYWYYKLVGGKRQVWNCIYVGNHQVKPPTYHEEYGSELPYIAIPNGRVMGRPFGKSDLYDVEQILREKDERLSNQANMHYKVVQGQMWQLVGAEAPDEVPPNVTPAPNQVIAPGPGNQIVPIQPWLPEMQIEDYNRRLDREAAAITGLNDLLLGLAPAQVLSSSKAVAALVANYESRIRPARTILYHAYYRIWEMAARVWSKNDKQVATIIGDWYRLSIVAPELTPRDTLETASMAMQLVQNRLWSMERGMDATGVDNTNDEKSIVREEQTDASLNPAAVMAMAQLMQTFNAMNQQAPPNAQAIAAAQQQSLSTAQVGNATRTAQGGGVAGSPSNNAPENSAPAPPEGQPPNAQPGQPNAPGAPGQPAPGQPQYGNFSRLTMRNGKTTGEIRTQEPI